MVVLMLAPAPMLPMAPLAGPDATPADPGETSYCGGPEPPRQARSVCAAKQGSVVVELALVPGFKFKKLPVANMFEWSPCCASVYKHPPCDDIKLGHASIACQANK